MEKLRVNEEDLASLFEEESEELDEELDEEIELAEEEVDPLDAMADAIMEKLRVSLNSYVG